MMSVSVATGTGFRFQRPDALFEGGMVTYQGAFATTTWAPTVGS